MNARALLWMTGVLVLGSGLPCAAAQSEAPDSTRLDVERLPPEALQITRDMYSIGFHLRAELGGQGFIGGVGRISQPGPLARIVAGYDLTDWFALDAQLGLAFHSSAAPAPPAPTAFQVYTLLAQARFQANLSTRAALWISGDLGAGTVHGDFLQAWGYDAAGDIGLVYGGTIGFDWHLWNPHHSLGMSLGAHQYPGLDDPAGEKTIAVESVAYLKYVF